MNKQYWCPDYFMSFFHLYNRDQNKNKILNLTQTVKQTFPKATQVIFVVDTHHMPVTSQKG